MDWFDDLSSWWGTTADPDTGALLADSADTASSFDLSSLGDVTDWSTFSAPVQDIDWRAYAAPEIDWGAFAQPVSGSDSYLSSIAPVAFTDNTGSASGDVSWFDTLEGIGKKYPNLVSGGVGALAFLTSANNARKNAKYQKKMLDRAEAERAARAAAAAKSNAPWVPTAYRTRTNIRGPSVDDRYGISSRGSDAFTAPSAYDYYEANRIQLAKGGLAHVRGSSGGQADKVPALLSDGEYVMDADVVSALGDGNNEAGAAKLDRMREDIRSHKRSAPASKVPPKAKEPMAYLKGKKNG